MSPTIKVVSHTAGPWKAGDDGTELTIRGRDGWNVATVLIGERAAEPTDRANARLIAAAPELLEALKQALVVMESVAETHGYDTEVGAVPTARVAIAKAAP